MIQDKYFEELRKFKIEFSNYIRSEREELQRFLERGIEYMRRACELKLCNTPAVLDDMIKTLFEFDRDLASLNLLLTRLDISIMRDEREIKWKERSSEVEKSI
jgi:hypothetical protein